MQHVLRIHTRITGAAFRTATHFSAGGMRGFQSISTVQHLVSDVRGEIEFQARRVRLQRAIGIDDVRSLEERAHHAAHLAVLVASQHGFALEPADLKSVALAQSVQVIHRQWKPALTDTLGGAFEVGEVVA